MSLAWLHLFAVYLFEVCDCDPRTKLAYFHHCNRSCLIWESKCHLLGYTYMLLWAVYLFEVCDYDLRTKLEYFFHGIRRLFRGTQNVSCLAKPICRFELSIYLKSVTTTSEPSWSTFTMVIQGSVMRSSPRPFLASFRCDHHPLLCW